MDLNSPWIKAAGPAVIAAIVVGAIITGAYSTDNAEPALAKEPAPLPDQVRYGAIEIGPVATGGQYAENRGDAVGGVGGFSDPQMFERSIAMHDERATGDFETASTNRAGAEMLVSDRYVRYLEIGAYSSRTSADVKVASVEALVREEERMGDVAVVYAPEALSRRYRVHIGPFATTVTNDDVRVFKDLLGAPDAVVVSIVKTPASDND